jgi:hemerythrin
MTRIAWTDDLSVGNEALDSQHKKLIDMINRLDDDHLSEADLGEVILGLLEYAATHFRDEEAYFVKAAPEIVAHHFESHGLFVSEAYHFVQRFHRGEALSLRKPVYDFLCKWLINHIRAEDCQYRH